MNTKQKEFVKRVFALKEKPHNLTEVQIASRLRISFSALQRWKHKIAAPTLDTYFRVGKILDSMEKKKMKKATA